MVDVRALKNTEIEIATYFDWNVRNITFYDYLEHFLSIGVFIENDEIESQKEPELKEVEPKEAESKEAEIKEGKEEEVKEE